MSAYTTSAASDSSTTNSPLKCPNSSKIDWIILEIGSTLCGRVSCSISDRDSDLVNIDSMHIHRITIYLLICYLWLHWTYSNWLIFFFSLTWRFALFCTLYGSSGLKPARPHFLGSHDSYAFYHTHTTHNNIYYIYIIYNR